MGNGPGTGQWVGPSAGAEVDSGTAEPTRDPAPMAQGNDTRGLGLGRGGASCPPTAYNRPLRTAPASAERFEVISGISSHSLRVGSRTCPVASTYTEHGEACRAVQGIARRNLLLGILGVLGVLMVLGVLELVSSGWVLLRLPGVLGPLRSQSDLDLETCTFD